MTAREDQAADAIAAIKPPGIRKTTARKAGKGKDK